jgi:hypothetical protein
MGQPANRNIVSKAAVNAALAAVAFPKIPFPRFIKVSSKNGLWIGLVQNFSFGTALIYPRLYARILHAMLVCGQKKPRDSG